MADQAKAGGGWLKGVVTTAVGLCSGAALMYVSPLIDKVIKPSKPVANFAAQAEGLSVNFQNRSQGGVEGWWDFGDGSALEPYAPDRDTVAHKYDKPGVYTVRLRLRNLLGDENERGVSVSVDATTTVAAGGPVVESLQVIPMRAETYAPATFKVVGKVKNADLCIWGLGERPIEVTPQTGAVERMVTLRRPGEHQIKLVAVKGSQTVEKVQTVQVLPAPPGRAMAIVRVTREVVKIETTQKIHTVAVAFPPKEQGNSYKFTAERPAEPGHQIKEAHFAQAPADQRVKGLALKIAPDGQKVVLSGELTRTPGVLHRTAPTPQWVVQIVMTQQRRARPILRQEEPEGQWLNVPGSTYLPIRKPPDGWESKFHKVTLELHEGNQVLWQNAELPRNATVQIRNRTYRVTAVEAGDQLRVDVVEVRTGPGTIGN